MQFQNDGDGGTEIGAPTPAVANPQYENPQAISEGLRHGFVNQGTSWGVGCDGVVLCSVM